MTPNTNIEQARDGFCHISRLQDGFVKNASDVRNRSSVLGNTSKTLLGSELFVWKLQKSIAKYISHYEIVVFVVTVCFFPMYVDTAQFQ